MGRSGRQYIYNGSSISYIMDGETELPVCLHSSDRKTNRTLGRYKTENFRATQNSRQK